MRLVIAGVVLVVLFTFVDAFCGHVETQHGIDAQLSVGVVMSYLVGVGTCISLIYSRPAWFERYVVPAALVSAALLLVFIGALVVL